MLQFDNDEWFYCEFTPSDKLLWFTGNEAAYTEPIIAQAQWDVSEE